MAWAKAKRRYRRLFRLELMLCACRAQTMSTGNFSPADLAADTEIL